jgi:hypothetical protein
MQLLVRLSQVSLLSPVLFRHGTTAPSFRCSLNSSLGAIEAAKLFTYLRAAMLQHHLPSRVIRLLLCWMLQGHLAVRGYFRKL